MDAGRAFRSDAPSTRSAPCPPCRHLPQHCEVLLTVAMRYRFDQAVTHDTRNRQRRVDRICGRQREAQVLQSEARLEQRRLVALLRDQLSHTITVPAP